MSANLKAAPHWLIPAIVAAFLLLTAIFSKPFHYGATHLALLATLYVLLALGMHLVTLLALRWGKVPGFLTVAVVAFILALHYREQSRPSGTAESLDKADVLALFLLLWVVAAAAYFLVLWLVRPRQTEPPAGVLLLAVVPLFFGLLLLSYYGSNTFRWHLLRHNVFLGALSYHLFAEDTAVVRAALWEDNEALYPPLEDPPEEMAVEGAPNIVFVLVDTLRADALIATGGAGGLMPQLDALVDESFVFTDVKTNASWTFPSMASFFTGLLPEEHGAVWESSLGEEKITLAEVLAARGYRTGAFIANGAWMREDRGMHQGFDVFRQLASGRAVYPRAEEINAAVFDWLAEPAEDDGRPVFLYVHYMDPHVPYLAAGIVDPASHDAARSGYESDLRYLDDQLRVLRETLAETLEGPIYTLVVADHGEEFGEHGERGHGRVLYDEVLRVPALLHAPEATSRGEIEDKLEGRDFFSLLGDLASAEPLDVRDWARRNARSERYASSYYTNRSPLYRLLRPYRAAICLQAIERDGYTLIWSGQGNTYELYDMRSDPQQLYNIAAANPEVVTRLAASMRAAPAYWTPEVAEQFSPEELERLRALGYLR